VKEILNKVRSTRIIGLSTNWFHVFLIVVIVLGILLRCINIDSRVYWDDEVITSIRVAGYQIANIVQVLLNKSTASASDLMIYQLPSSAMSFSDTVQGLIAEEPQHPPIYFLLARLWIQLFKNFGSSVVVIRSFSVFISLITFPCLYWLCLELFRSRYVGFIAMAIMAVSPFHLFYAHAARPYTLWFLAITLSSTLLLRSLRLNTSLSWIAYSVSVILALYICFISVFVFISHGIYIVLMQGKRLTKATVLYLITMAVSSLAFLPWLLATNSNLRALNTTTGWSSEKLGSLNLLRLSLNNLREVFFSIGQGYAYLTFLLLICIVFSFYFLWRKVPKSVWVFIFSLVGVTVIALLVPDLLRGGERRSTASRYFIAPYLGINLSLSYLFCIQGSVVVGWLRNFWQAIAAFLLTLGAVSCINLNQSEVSFHPDFSNIKVPAQTINKYERPLIVTNLDIKNITSSNNVIGSIGFSYLLKPDTQFQFIANNSQIDFSEPSKTVFVYVEGSTIFLKSESAK